VGLDHQAARLRGRHLGHDTRRDAFARA
jgi:hypothetical protein